MCHLLQVKKKVHNVYILYILVPVNLVILTIENEMVHLYFIRAAQTDAESHNI